MGISYTLLDSNTEKDDQIRYLGNKILSEKSLRDLIYYCSSKLGIDRTVGLAALNAYSQANILLDTQIGKDVKDLFLSNPLKTVGMIGNIRPISNFLIKKGFNVKILDNSFSPARTSQLVPITTLEDLFDVHHLIVSGSALVFDTFSNIIEIVKEIQGEKILLGPSAQIIPKIAFNMGFSFIGSSKVRDTRLTLSAIKEGGGYRDFKHHTEKYSFQAPEVD